jgi:hypothetical protein
VERIAELAAPTEKTTAAFEDARFLEHGCMTAALLMLITYVEGAAQPIGSMIASPANGQLIERSPHREE